MRRTAATLMAAALLLLGGCDFIAPAKSPFHGIDVTGMKAGGQLRLEDPKGRVRTLADFRGQVVAVIFGYTQCPDVCPTTLADYAKAMKLLGADATRVQVLFVTVDPKRDTRELLSEYVAAFDPRFIPLRGDPAATERTTDDFHVYVAQREGKTPDTYTVDHTAQVFVFDPQGRLRLMVPPGTPPADIASDLRILAKS